MRGWVVKYRDGSIIKEWEYEDRTFRMLPRQRDITDVALIWDDKVWVIKDKENYFEYKTMSMLMGGRVSHPMVEFRHIGYWENNKKIVYKLNDRTGQLAIEVRDE